MGTGEPIHSQEMGGTPPCSGWSAPMQGAVRGSKLNGVDTGPLYKCRLLVFLPAQALRSGLVDYYVATLVPRDD